jgi:hypothetical protein
VRAVIVDEFDFSMLKLEKEQKDTAESPQSQTEELLAVLAKLCVSSGNALRSDLFAAFVSATSGCLNGVSETENLLSSYLAGTELIAPSKNVSARTRESVTHANLTHCAIRCNNDRQLSELVRLINAARGSGCVAVFVNTPYRAKVQCSVITEYVFTKHPADTEVSAG